MYQLLNITPMPVSTYCAIYKLGMSVTFGAQLGLSMSVWNNFGYPTNPESLDSMD